MTPNYEIIGVGGRELPIIGGLLKVEDNGRVFYVSSKPFGTGTFSGNLVDMHEYDHYLKNGRHISFRTPTTRESLLAAAYNFKALVKPRFFGPPQPLLQLGHLFRTPEGVWVGNSADAWPLLYSFDEKLLQYSLTPDRRVNGIYLLDNGYAFAPYDSFKTGEPQEAREFAEGGLARVLERTPEKVAQTLQTIAENYRRGVFVHGFGPQEPVFTHSVMRVASLYPGRDSDRDRLYVAISGDGRCDSFGGYAFGVLK